MKFDDRLKRFDRERVTAAVRGHGNATPIGMMVSAVRSYLVDENKPVSIQCRDQIPGPERTKFPVIDRHPVRFQFPKLRSDSDAWGVLGDLGYFDFVGRTLWERFPFLCELLGDHPYDFIDVFKSFLFSTSGGRSADAH